MKLLTASSGSYPRVGGEPNQQRLRSAYRKWEEGKVSDDELEEVYQDYTEEVIREQEKAGLDVVTDGQIRWYDPLSHFAREIEGCEIDGLLRFFDTNFYFRQPVVIDELDRKGSIVKDEFILATKISKKTLKPVLPGPYTLAKLSIDKHYSDLTNLALDFADVISREVETLVDAGAEEIQVDEPAILDNEDDYDIFSKSTEKLAGRKGNSQLNLTVYFGDTSPLYDRLQDLPVDVLGLDFTYSPDLPDLIEDEGSDKPLSLGLIDARNTKLEDPDDVLSTIKRIVPNVEASKVYLNPSYGLELLPRKKAYEKLKNMVRIAEKFEGGA